MKRIVIADDSATARLFVRRCLEVAGLREADFAEAANGAEALERMKQAPTDLLVTDLNMPDCDGRELLRRIAASPKLNGTPVLVVTSSRNEAVEADLLSLGARAVLGKPISPPVAAGALRDLGLIAEDTP